MDLFKLLVERR